MQGFAGAYVDESLTISYPLPGKPGATGPVVLAVEAEVERVQTQCRGGLYECTATMYSSERFVLEIEESEATQ